MIVTNDLMKLAHRLQEFRAKAGLSQSGLAEKSGVPAPTIRDLEQGRRLPTWPTLRRLSAALGVSLGGWDGLDDEEPGPVKKRARR